MRWSETGPTPAAFWRAALAVPLLWLWVALRRAPAATTAHTSSLPRRYLWLAGVFFAGDLIFWHWAIMFTSVANATFLATCAPIFVTLVAWLFLGQRIRPGFIAAIFLALIGALLLVGPNWSFSAEAPRGGAMLGDVMGIITAIFFASYLLVVGRARGHYDTAYLMAWSTTITALTILPVAIGAHWLAAEPFFPRTAQGWWVLVGLALLPQVIGQSLIAYALAHLPATFASVGMLLEPIVAALLAWLLLQEAMLPLQLLGAAAVLCGIAMAHANRETART